jgi:WW domain-binding protein 4
MKAEAERRRTQGVAGEWEAVEQPMSSEDNGEGNTMAESSKKREAEGPLELEDTRSFKLRKKIAPSVTDAWDADLIPIKLKPKKKSETPEPGEGVKEEEESAQSGGEAPIKWTSRGWKRPEDEPDETLNSPILKNEEAEAEVIAPPEPAVTVSKPDVKEETGVPPMKLEPSADTPSETGAVFRKRKLGGNRGRR